MKALTSKTYEALLSALNDGQKAPVLHTDGPVLVLAGAGSGKTRVITYRIAYLIASKRAKPENILAMTFTNKAAAEMRRRVESLVPCAAEKIWMGTFHSTFARMLRIDGDKIGIGRNFSIYDEDDQKRLIKQLIKEHNLTTELDPAQVRAKISAAKSALLTPELFAAEASDDLEERVAGIYGEYQIRLKENNALDFDDLLVKPITLLQTFTRVLNTYQERFHYLLVDEYQDTNRAQYHLLRLLADKRHNICVVGDDDQSIYRWRGADITNILNFEKNYANCRVYYLEQNYRSTKNILSAAHSVIEKNIGRKHKQLWTNKEEGEKVTIISAASDFEECRAVLQKLEQEFHKKKRNFKDFAILYRTNAQSRLLEEALRRNGISYVIVGGVRFYERKEVKDVLAYLRLISNPDDSANLLRIINYPSRGIGDITIEKVTQAASAWGITLFAALGRASKIEGIAESMQNRLLRFHDMLLKYMELKGEMSPAELASALVDELGILRIFKEDGTPESLNRADNIRELLNAIMDFNHIYKGADLDHFLETVSLITDIDTWNDRTNAVTLMTLHSAKGLEFPVVFITGLEEGLFPIRRSFDSTADLEEERRLFYVGATRAQEKLYLTWSNQRRRMGEIQSALPSRFLGELDPAYVLHESPSAAPEVRGRTKRRRDSAADFYQEAPRYEDESQELFVLNTGTRVCHPMFGNGTILLLERSSRGTKATIRFDAHGEKKILLEYTSLEIIT